MIRLKKPVQLLEWGQGTNTLNQTWRVIGHGKISSKPKTVDGITTMIVAVDGPLNRENLKEDAIKVQQQGEGMTPGTDHWGEVAVGKLKSIKDSGSRTVIQIALKGAIKIG
jgi:hypothetical protein